VHFVMESGVIADLKSLLVNTTDKRAVYLMPGVCEFFGRFGENHPRLICDSYNDILKILLDLTNDTQFQALAMSNLGLMGRTHEGKRCINEKLQLDMSILMKAIGSILEGHDMSFKKEAALAALAHLMEVEDVEQKDLMPITLSWFSMASEKPIKAVWDCAKYHCPDVRILALAALRNIALLSWGRDALLEECAGFFEWILHRDPDARKEEMDAKFSVIAALVEDANKIKSPEKRAALRTHFNEGPYTGGASVTVTSDIPQ